MLETEMTEKPGQEKYVQKNSCIGKLALTLEGLCISRYGHIHITNNW